MAVEAGDVEKAAAFFKNPLVVGIRLAKQYFECFAGRVASVVKLLYLHVYATENVL